MNTYQTKMSDLKSLPAINFRQLEIFRVVYHERSLTNSALELNCTRASIKRSCEDFEKAIGRPLFDVGSDKSLSPTEFATALVGQLGPLSRALRHLREGVRAMHEDGRLLRFAAAREFFQDSFFADLLKRFQIKALFRPTFGRIEIHRFRSALQNAECDVYFGIGLAESDRLDLIELGPIGWKVIQCEDDSIVPLPSISSLRSQQWWIRRAGEFGAAETLLAEFESKGATGGALLEDGQMPPAGIVFQPDTKPSADVTNAIWPCYRFFAAMRKKHPYSELKSRLSHAAFS